MSSASVEVKSFTCLRPIEHHHFHLRGRWLLFDVNGLRVVPSDAMDGVILRLASPSIHRSELIETLQSTSSPVENVSTRVDFLCEEGFLLPPEAPAQMAELGAPTSYATFMVNVSHRCNLTCPYCYVNRGHFDYETKPIPRMRADTAAQIVDKIHESFPGLSTYGYHFYGGEPLLNFRAIRQIVEEAQTKARETSTRCDFHITTNGTSLSREIADFMDQHRFTVYFSIDGDQQNHDQLRKYINGRGSYADVEANLAYLRTKPGIHLIGSSVIRKGFRLSKALDHLQQHGANQCKAERVRLQDDDVLSLSGDLHDEYLRDIEGLVDHYIDYLSSGRKPMDFRLSSKILQVFTKKRRSFFCPAGDRMFGISADGEIYPCALHVGRPQSKLGDLSNGIDRDKQRAFRAKFSPENQSACRTCWTRHLCGGGCSAMVDRFGHEDCESLRAESEAAIAIFQHFAEDDPLKLLGLVSPKVVKWVNGELKKPAVLTPSESAAQRVHEAAGGDA
jgi:uncharacterized protein